MDSFNETMCNLTLSHEQTTTIYNLCSELVVNVSKFSEHLIKGQNGLDALNALQFSSKYICNKLAEWSRKFESNHLYLAPVKLALGLRNDMFKGQSVNIAVPRCLRRSV